MSRMTVAAGKIKEIRLGVAAAIFLIVSGGAITDSLAEDLPADWIEVSAGSEFTLMAPAGTEFQPAEGTDSFVGSFLTPDFKLSFDYGLYSNPLNDLSSDSHYERRDMLVDGKPAYVVTAYAPRFSAAQPYFMGVHVPNVERTIIGPRKFTMFGFFTTADHYPVIERIFQTIQFE